jgi:dienelactone hydrolase
MKKLLITLALFWSQVGAQEIVKFEYTSLDGKIDNLEAVIRKPTKVANGKAVIIMHHAGGWREGTTVPYAELLSQNGFLTFEPRLFNSKPKLSSEYIGEVFGALQYVSSISGVDKKQISLMGMSFGANLSIFSATEWAHKKFTDGSIAFKSIAALYPVCWRHAANIKRSLKASVENPKTPDDFEDRWIGASVKIMTGTMDDYDGRDPNACKEFIESIPDPTQRSQFSLIQFEGATHGWDQPSRSFFAPTACKGKGCTNTNTYNPEVTKKGLNEVLIFFSKE